MQKKRTLDNILVIRVLFTAYLYNGTSLYLQLFHSGSRKAGVRLTEFDQYIQQLSNHLIPFGKITEQQLKKLFPKTKKLKVPDLSSLPLKPITYLSWSDISLNKKFIVYNLNEKLVGIECKYTLINKNNICSFCNCFGQVTFISTITKAKKAKNPDYYKAIGNYICFNSDECNKRITNVAYLTTFLENSLKEKE